MNARTRNFSARKSTTTQSGENLNVAMRGSLYDIQSQSRRGTQVVGYRGTKRPSGLKDGDVTVRSVDDTKVAVGISDAKGNVQEMIFSQDMTSYAPFQEGSGAPSVTANFPDDGDWGWYYDTVAGAMYWVRNRSGVLLKPNFLSISGSLQTGQHGDRSAEVATMHAFTQISGTITDAQHGARSGGTLHANAIAGGAAGFLSGTDKALIDTATAAATANALVKRGAAGAASFAGTVDVVNVDASGRYQVAGLNILGPRNTGWTAFSGVTNKATAYATGTVTHVELAERVAAIQVALTTHGILGP